MSESHPELDPELPDDALPEDIDDAEKNCTMPADIWRAKSEDLGDTYEK